MGLIFKPVKCRSLSICGGKPSQVDFKLIDYSAATNPIRVVIKSLMVEPHKFLGQTLTFKNTANDHYEFL